MAMSNTELVDLFCRLVSIPSPSGKEAGVARAVLGELRRRRINAHIDKTGSLTRSNSGNVIATIPGNKNRLVFVAHMDTVESGDRKVRPIIKNGVIRSDGKTILGADNKAGVAPLIVALGEIIKMRERPTVLGIFSTREEEGIMGIKHIPRGRGNDFTFVLDSEGPAGEFVNRALGSTLFDIEIYGREAHAALNPEKGANAVKAAGLLISSLELGRRKHDSILNIGLIEGGRRRNVIPGRVVLKCGTRAFDQKAIDRTLKEVEAATKRACAATKCTYHIRMETDEREPPFFIKPGHGIIRMARYAARRAGLKFVLGSRMATFEANILANRGYKPLVMCHGGALPHSTAESVTIKELEKTTEMIVAMAEFASKKRF